SLSRVRFTPCLRAATRFLFLSTAQPFLKNFPRVICSATGAALSLVRLLIRPESFGRPRAALFLLTRLETSLSMCSQSCSVFYKKAKFNRSVNSDRLTLIFQLSPPLPPIPH